jgi:hypothetical protein
MRHGVLVLALGLSPIAEAQEEETRGGGLEYGVEVDVNSRYLFRGVAFSQEPVSQITASATFSGVALYAWGNVLLLREPQQHDFNELDFGASYAYSFGNFTLEPAFDAYVFRVPAPREAVHTTEGSLRVSYSLGPASAFSRHTVDLGGNRGAYYAEAGLAFDHAPSRRISFSSVLTFAWASARFNAGHFGVDEGGWNHVGVELSLTYSPDDRLYIKPHFELTSLAGSALRRYSDEPTVSSFGVAVGFFRD